MTHEERYERLQRQLDELAERHGELLVGHATLEGKLNKQRGLVAILVAGALALLGMLLNLLMTTNDKADASSLAKVEQRVNAAESAQARQGALLQGIADGQVETKASIVKLNEKIDAALLALPRGKGKGDR